MGKGSVTRARILDEAIRIASREGLEGLSIGTLATALEMSKSGLFAHFGSKEALQAAVLQELGQRFAARVLASVEEAAPGVGRLDALFEAWLAWSRDPALPGGCPVLAACFELDDREGEPREVLVRMQEALRQRVMALVAGVFPAVQAEQAAFDFKGIQLAFHHAHRVLRNPEAVTWARNAYRRWLRNLQQEQGASPA